MSVLPETLDKLRAVDWEEIGVRLCAYATWKARNHRWRTGVSPLVAAGSSAEDIAREAILRVLDGRRQWDPVRGPLLPYLQGVVDSLISHLATSADNVFVIGELAPPRDRAEAEEELRSAGVDPSKVGMRMARAAKEQLAETVDVQVDRRPPQRRAFGRSIGIGLAVVAGVVLLRLDLGRNASSFRERAPVSSAPKRWVGTSTEVEPGRTVPAGILAAATDVSSPTTPASISGSPAPARETVSTPAALPADHPYADVVQSGSGAVTAAARETWILNSENWQEAEGLLPPPILNRVKSGDYWYRVQDIDPVVFRRNYSRRFWDASFANEGNYDIDPATCGLKDKKTGTNPSFYFGYPFPRIDSKDPVAGCKIAWNIEAATSMGEGWGATFTMNGVDESGEYKRIEMSLEAEYYLGRHGGPFPTAGDLRSATSTEVHAPKELDGNAMLMRRRNATGDQDEFFFYLPKLRKVRRTSPVTNSDPIAGTEIFGEDVNCFASKTEYYRWKLVGEGEVLAPMHVREPLQQKPVSDTRFTIELPYLGAAYESADSTGVPWLVVENLSLATRPVWIVEGTQSNPYHGFSRVTLYIDKEMYRIYWKLVYDRSGVNFYNTMCVYHWTRTEDGSFSGVWPSLVLGVNDRTNRACLMGRQTSEFVERRFPKDYSTFEYFIRQRR